jgi:ABC-2 type transport system permease protein
MSQLRKILEIGRVNLLRQVRDRGDLFFVFVLPVIIIVALGLQFGGWSSARLGVAAPAGDAAADALVAAIAADPMGFDIRRFDDRAELEARVERGQLEAAVVIPDGFTEALAGTATAEVVFLGTADALTTGLRAPIDAAVARLGAIATATRVAAAEGLATQAEAAAAAGAGYEVVPGVEVSVTQVGEPGMFAGFSQFTFGASTQLVLFMFLTSMTAATRLVTTRQLGVSRRMTATPTAAWTIVTGEALGRFLVAILQAAFIVLVTAVAFNVSWGNPLATGTLIVLFGVVCSGFALLVGAVARNADQAGSLGVFLGLALGALGGCMMPIQTMPDVMQSFARLIPQSWALLGIQEVIRTGGGLETVVPNVVVLAAYGAVVLALASWRFRKAITG